jgi:phage gpG-like protein
MPFSAEIVDSGFGEAVDKAVNFNVADFAPELASLGAALVDEIKGEFGGARDPYGNKWAPLKAVTIEEKQKRGSPTPDQILQDTGLLLRSFKFEVQDTGLSVFTDRIFPDGTTAEIHQFGGTHPRSGSFIAARALLPWEEPLPLDWQSLISDVYLQIGVDRIFK